MARIIPFKGILYNQDKINTPNDVVAPPYDVISEKKRQELHDRHEFNVIRLILGLDQPDDSPENNRHTRAAAYFQKWIETEVLKMDDAPALYLTSVDFLSCGTQKTRYGLIAQVGLEPFENGIILPHEQTFSSVKSERLELLKLCKANFSQIFSIYSDQDGIFNTLRAAVKAMPPVLELTDDVKERHRLWKITDKDIIENIQQKMDSQKLFIADGHHRYETALNYREYLKKTDPSFTENHPANAIMMYLCSMEDPGLIIYPTHRMLHSASSNKIETLMEAAKRFFDITEIPFTQSYEEALADFRKTLEETQDNTRIGVAINGHNLLYTLTLKPESTDLVLGHLPASLKSLDVTVLTYLILIDLLGLEPDALDKEKLITYTENDTEAIESALSGEAKLSFILNATTIKQVQDIAETGQTMPRKTTFFYPKALTGLVFNTLRK